MMDPIYCPSESARTRHYRVVGDASEIDKFTTNCGSMKIQISIISHCRRFQTTNDDEKEQRLHRIRTDSIYSNVLLGGGGGS